jgi:chromosome segregation ATPase
MSKFHRQFATNPCTGQPIATGDAALRAATERAKANPTPDRRTTDDLREERQKLVERIEHHEALRDRYQAELKEVQTKLSAQESALAVLKELKRRDQAAECEYIIQRLQDEEGALNREIAKNVNIIAGTRKLFDEWVAANSSKLKELEAQEKLLSAAGL